MYLKLLGVTKCPNGPITYKFTDAIFLTKLASILNSQKSKFRHFRSLLTKSLGKCQYFKFYFADIEQNMQ